MVDNLLTPTHILLILAVALIVLGPKRLPEAGRGLGSAIRDFKEVVSPFRKLTRAACTRAVARDGPGSDRSAMTARLA
jgi:TatA/E family protein of Tat protein translocase